MAAKKTTVIPGDSKLERRKKRDDSTDLLHFIEAQETALSPVEQEIMTRSMEIRDELVSRLIYPKEHESPGLSGVILRTILEKHGLSLDTYRRMQQFTFRPIVVRDRKLDIKQRPAEGPQAERIYRIVAEIRAEFDRQMGLITPIFEKVIHSYAYYRAKTEVEMESVIAEGAKDKLTGFIQSPEYISKLYSIELKRLESQTDRVMVVITFDLDRFKTENDVTHDHDLVDRELLKPIADAVSKVLRGLDIKCRPGGDEFLIILPDFIEESVDANGQIVDNVVKVVEKIQAAISTVMRLSNPNEPVTATVGYLIVRPNDTNRPLTASEARARADRAGYAAKQTRRGSSLEWNPDLPPIKKDAGFFRREIEAALARVYEDPDIDFLSEDIDVLAEKMARQHSLLEQKNKS